MLGRIRSALGPRPEIPEIPREYREASAGEPAAAAPVERFCERVADYRAAVTRVAAEDGLIAAVAAACEERGSRRVAAAPAAAWRPGGIEVVTDGPERDARELDAV